MVWCVVTLTDALERKDSNWIYYEFDWADDR